MPSLLPCAFKLSVLPKDDKDQPQAVQNGYNVVRDCRAMQTKAETEDENPIDQRRQGCAGSIHYTSWDDYTLQRNSTRCL